MSPICRPNPSRPGIRSPHRLVEGKGFELRRRKPADYSLLPVGRWVPPQKRAAYFDFGCQCVNASWPLFAWGTAAGRPGRPGAGREPSAACLEGAVAPGGLLPGARIERSRSDEAGSALRTRPGRRSRAIRRAVADAPQAAYLETLRGHMPAHLAVASLVQHDRKCCGAGPRTLLASLQR